MIGIGVIGYGFWGPNLVRNFSETPGSKVVAVSDLYSERLAQVQARYPTVKVTVDHRDLFTDPDIDAILVATPVGSHFDLVMQSLDAGKHVLVEKHLAVSSEQVRNCP
jgi:predicted dehydrogenase